MLPAMCAYVVQQASRGKGDRKIYLASEKSKGKETSPPARKGREIGTKIYIVAVKIQLFKTTYRKSLLGEYLL